MKKISVYIMLFTLLFATACENEITLNEEYIKLNDGLVIPDYVTLKDINTWKIKEINLGDDYAYDIMTGDFVRKNAAYDAIKEKDEDAIILDVGEYIISVGDTEEGSLPGDVYIARYKNDGTLLCEKTYGGMDFDYPYTASYNEKMGILVSGKSQSPESVFGSNPFCALFDKDTLEFKWSKRVQFAGSADCLSDTAAYISCGERVGDEVKIVVTKVSGSGDIIWKSDPIEQIVSDITELSSGKIVVSQHHVDNGKVINKLILIDETGKIVKETETEIFGNLTATDDGGFIIVAERAVRTVPQPAYISAIWTDNETVAAKYNEALEIVWRKTYDTLKGAVGTDTVVSKKDGSLMIKKAEKVKGIEK